MKEDTRGLLDKAGRAIAAAALLLREGQAEFAAGRAYYAMFYTAEALLGEQGLHFRKHAGVHAAYGERFAKPGLLDPKFHRWILNAFDIRLTGEYGVGAMVDPEETQGLIDQANEFLHEAQRFLGQTPGQTADADRKQGPPT
jgi:uncharacterized protein (UPF0332 family)